MAIVFKVNGGVFIDHTLLIADSYKQCYVQPCGFSVHMQPYSHLSFRYKPPYFDVAVPYIKSKVCSKAQRKRKFPFSSEEEAALEYQSSIVDKLQAVLKQIQNGMLKSSCKCTVENVSEYLPVEGNNTVNMKCLVRKSLYHDDQLTIYLGIEDIHTEFKYILNKLVTYSGDKPRMICLSREVCLLPANCSFLCSDISYMQPLIEKCKQEGGYDVVVVDPPWQNKSAKRGHKYNWLTLEQIKSLPLEAFMKETCYVLIWVTNKRKFHDFVKSELFPLNKISLLCEWHWVKLTNTLEPVFPFDSNHKRPYETLLVGKRCKTNDQPNVTEGGIKSFGDIAKADRSNSIVFCSVPCTVHSHKPPLDKLIRDYLLLDNPEPKCLELFARNLTAGWTSWGNEVLAMQNLKHFKFVADNENE